MGAAAALTALVVLVVIVIRRPRPALSLGLPLAMMAGFGLPALIHHVAVGLVRPAMEVGWKDARRTPSIAPGGAAAGRWLRDHSGPDDVVATNAHCFRWLNNRCDNRHHWISAYTERRVLVEGWGYSSASLGRMPLYGESGLGAEPFADRERLAVNDAAFRAPSPRTIGRLRDRYGVRWLFVDNSDHRPAPTLGRHATLRYRAGCCAVYEVAPAQVSGPGV
jgi:hypothetical protein